MSSDKRKPDFYRVVRDGIDGAREYASIEGGWTIHLHEAVSFATESEARYGILASERIVPVYVKVIRKPKLHDFAWAMAQMLRHGKRVCFRPEMSPNNYYEFRPGRGLFLVDSVTGNNVAVKLDEYKMRQKTWQLWEAP